MSSERTGKKVAIVGFAESWKSAPFADDAVEIWALNEFWKYAPRWSRWFELHDAETLGVTTRDLSEGEQKRHLDWLSQAHDGGRPIYMQPQFCDGRFPNATPYPLDRMVARFGRYFTSTIGYMLALAIDEGYSWIGLYGVDLASHQEYPYQRPNAEYLIGMARGLGIEVEVAAHSAILRSNFLYGYEQEPTAHPLVAFARDQIGKLKQEHEKHLVTANTIDGAMQAYQNLIAAADFSARGAKVA